MTEDLLAGLLALSALVCLLVAGIFLAFSNFVMKALARLSAPCGIAAMQSINVTVLNPLFFLLFFGTVVPCLIAAMASVADWADPRAPYLLAGGLLYPLGTVGVTMVCNVPLNNALATADPNSEQAAGLWSRYLRDWVFWNHVRAVAAIAAAVAFLIALGMAAPPT